MTDSRQLALDLPSRPALGRAAFFVTAANRLALAQVDRWPAWPGGRLALCGPAGSGKTHLAHVWAARSGARILPGAALGALDPGAVAPDAAVAVEDVDGLHGLPDPSAAEEALFHLFNRLGAGGGALLVSGRAGPGLWRIALPDLASRLAAAPVAALEPPDDALLEAILVKLFGDRGVAVAPEVVRYLVARMERSFEAAEALVAWLDGAALSRGGPVTVRLAAEAVAER